MKWIDSKNENIATAGWLTLSSMISIKPDHELDMPLIEKFIDRVQEDIHSAPTDIHAFIISVGCYISSLSEKAKSISKKIGKVTVNMGETACKVSDATEYIEKVAKANRIGK